MVVDGWCGGKLRIGNNGWRGGKQRLVITVGVEGSKDW